MSRFLRSRDAVGTTRVVRCRHAHRRRRRWFWTLDLSLQSPQNRNGHRRAPASSRALRPSPGRKNNTSENRWLTGCSGVLPSAKLDTAIGFNRTGTLTRYDKLQSTIVASFLEALAKQRVWHWLEESKGYTVDGEVNIGTGRIDLLAESPSGEITGVELKRASEFGLDRDVYAQTHRYIDSGALDKLYFAAPDADKLGTNPESDPVDQMSIRAISYRLAAGVDEDWYTPSEV